MISIGWRNLRQSPLRVAVAIGSVTFAVVLVTCEIGMMFGMTRNASVLVDKSAADLLVAAPDNKTFNFAGPIPHRKKYQVASVSGVASVEEFNPVMSIWKSTDGNNAAVQVIAFDLNGDLAPRLQMVAGDIRNLHNRNAVVIDESARSMLGNPTLGDQVEIRNRRARIIGVCKNMRSFSTMPMIFTSLRRGNSYSWGDDSNASSLKKSIYFLVKVAPGNDLKVVQQAIRDRISGIEVYTREGMSWKTRGFWLVETGMGMAFLFVGFLGLLVGGVILSQTLFAMTMERISEFGVLKALGAGMPEISRVVIEQGLICGGIGLVIGLIISLGVRSLAHSAGTEIEIGWPLVIGVIIVVAILSSGASLLSISRLRRLEPATVFRA